jgi:hypothetical protein
MPSCRLVFVSIEGASPLDIPLHAHIVILAQRRRGLLRQTHKEAIETRHLPVGRRLAGSYQSLRRQAARRRRFVIEHNAEPKPFTRTADPDKIIQAVRRGHQV